MYLFRKTPARDGLRVQCLCRFSSMPGRQQNCCLGNPRRGPMAALVRLEGKSHGAGPPAGDEPAAGGGVPGAGDGAVPAWAPAVPARRRRRHQQLRGRHPRRVLFLLGRPRVLSGLPVSECCMCGHYDRRPWSVFRILCPPQQQAAAGATDLLQMASVVLLTSWSAVFGMASWEWYGFPQYMCTCCHLFCC